ncbi:hypothetical protein FIBSPDRAFT_879247 [Athelia psychrophila]|uniref:Uncharacterized protein n=1 Tax=Athelia psychrophila TaxID=1759441 RepID=A0A167U7R4_9AGAM|nr:hypothetical protein FIBSPDRAFT_879247 [Fibularhizoctonia sp. CBS 109695]
MLLWIALQLVSALALIQAEPAPLALSNHSTAPFIFNSLSSLLQLWPNTYHQNGHTIVPGTLQPFTLLYHGRKDTDPPQSPEWFAFDPEMSHTLMVLLGGPTYLITYRTTKPARVLYFDGMSAAWGSLGWMDTQEVLLRGAGTKGPQEKDEICWMDDYKCAKKLCKWASSRNIEGFVRMNAGFELIWCDFTSPTLEIVSHLNITVPGTPAAGPRGPWDPQKQSGSESEFDYSDFPQRPFPVDPGYPGPGGPRQDSLGGATMAPLAVSSAGEWLRIATNRAFSPQPQITLDHSKLVTYYHPRLTSLAPSRAGNGSDITMRMHRVLTGISEGDAASVATELEDALSRDDSGSGSGTDWGAAARGVVEHWASRLMQLRRGLNEAITAPDANVTQVALDVRLLTYMPLSPYMALGSAPNASGSALFFAKGTGATPRAEEPLELELESAFDRCTYSATGFASSRAFTPQETLLQSSIAAVLERVCFDIGVIFSESYNGSSSASQASESLQPSLSDENDSKSRVMSFVTLIEGWAARTNALVAWLDWTEWLRCDEACGLDSVCAMPLWPIETPDQDQDGTQDSGREAEWQPRCHKLKGSTVPWA